MNSSKYTHMLDNVVFKGNDLIQKSRFDLSLQQQKVILFIISKIERGDSEFKMYEFSISEFCRVCGIDFANGKNYANLKAAIKGIADRSVWIKLENGTETLLRWIEKPYIDRGSGTIRIRLDRDMKPYLLNLKNNYTRYELFWIISFCSKYTIRFYELINCVHFCDLSSYKKEFDLDEMKLLLGAEKYRTYQSFKERVLEPCIKEVNEKSDKIASYETVKTGRAITKIILSISTKDFRERAKLAKEIEGKLQTV